MGFFTVTDPDGSATARLEAELKRLDDEDKARVDRGEMEQTQRGYRGKGK
jgi:hypothetical protein